MALRAAGKETAVLARPSKYTPEFRPEALNGTYKAELIKLHGPWRTRRQLEIAIIEWIDWYNHRRLHSEIGDVPPAEHETRWYVNKTSPSPSKPITRTAPTRVTSDI